MLRILQLGQEGVPVSRRQKAYAIGAAISLSWIAWFYVLLEPSAFIHIFGPTTGDRFSLSGTFGDSFGVIASLMTTIAAVGVYVTFSNEQHARGIHHFESNFFTLLGNLESITSQMRVDMQRTNRESKYKADYHRLKRKGTTEVIRKYDGREALQIILYVIRNDITPSGYANIKLVSKTYDQTYDRFVDHLGHYFRTIYHIYKLIDDRCPSDPGLANHYARIVRSQLSNSELCLLAYNCVVGEGRFKFRKFAVKFALFHNLHRDRLDEYERAELAFFQRKINDAAFRFDETPPITYDD